MYLQHWLHDVMQCRDTHNDCQLHARSVTSSRDAGKDTYICMQVLGKLPVDLAIGVIQAADMRLVECLRRVPEDYHPLVLRAHFPAVTTKQVLDITMRDSFGTAPEPAILRSLFLAAATFTGLKELHVSLGGGSLVVTDEVAKSFNTALLNFSELTCLSVRGGFEGLGVLTDPVALTIANALPGLKHLNALSLDIEQFSVLLFGNEEPEVLSVDTVSALLTSVGTCKQLRTLTLVSVIPRGVCSSEDKQLATLLATSVFSLADLRTLSLRGSITLPRLSALQERLPVSTPAWLVRLRELDLSDNGLCQDGAMSLSYMMPKLVNLEHINLSRNDIPEYGAIALARAFSQLTNLTFIDVSRNKFRDEGSAALSEAWAFLPKVAHLNVSQCDITAFGSVSLAACIGNFSSLQHLNLCFCDLTVTDAFFTPVDASSAQSLAEALQKHNSLTQLNLSRTELNSDALNYLAPCLSIHSGLRVLELQYNRYIGSDGVISLAEHLSALTALQCLRLTSRSVSTEAAEALAASLVILTNLYKLDLSGFRTSEEGSIALCRSFSKLVRVQELDVSACELAATAAAVLADSLRQMGELTELRVSNNLIEDSGAQAIAPVLANISRLAWVDMDYTQMTLIGAEAVARALSSLKAVRGFSVTLPDSEVDRQQLPTILRKPWVWIRWEDTYLRSTRVGRVPGPAILHQLPPTIP